MTKKEKISPKGGKTIETDLLLGRAIPSPLTMPLRCIQKNISPRCEGSLISILMPISVKDPARLNQQKGGSFGRRGRLLKAVLQTAHSFFGTSEHTDFLVPKTPSCYLDNNVCEILLFNINQ